MRQAFNAIAVALLLLVTRVAVYADEPSYNPSEDQLVKLRIAAEQGDAKAQYDIAWLYLNGSDAAVPKNEPEGIRWLRKAAEQNYAIAEYALGVVYSNGDCALIAFRDWSLRLRSSSQFQHKPSVKQAVGRKGVVWNLSSLNRRINRAAILLLDFSPEMIHSRNDVKKAERNRPPLYLKTTLYNFYLNPLNTSDTKPDKKRNTTLSKAPCPRSSLTLDQPANNRN